MADFLPVGSRTRERLAHDERSEFDGGMSFRLPPKVPMAVRTALATTTSRDMVGILLPIDMPLSCSRAARNMAMMKEGDAGDRR